MARSGRADHHLREIEGARGSEGSGRVFQMSYGQVDRLASGAEPPDRPLGLDRAFNGVTELGRNIDATSRSAGCSTLR